MINPAQERFKLDHIAKWAMSVGAEDPVEMLNMVMRLMPSAMASAGRLRPLDALYSVVNRLQAREAMERAERL